MTIHSSIYECTILHAAFISISRKMFKGTVLFCTGSLDELREQKEGIRKRLKKIL